MTRWAWLIVLVLWMAPGHAEPRPGPFTRDLLFRALEQAPTVRLLSINPGEGYVKDPTGAEAKPAGPVFMGYPVLGSTVLSGVEKSRLVRAFTAGVANKRDAARAQCFLPHHALEATVDGELSQVLVCYQCLQLKARRQRAREPAQTLSLLTQGSPASVFEELVSKHRLAR